VSSGATLGLGLFGVSSDGSKLPEAEFAYLGRRIRMALKNDYKARIEQEIREFSRI
jgi:hypothetical protein